MTRPTSRKPTTQKRTEKSARCYAPRVATNEEMSARFRTALELSDLAVRMMRQNLRREHPDASEAEIDELLGRWMRHRPGAEHGDCPGRPITFPRR